MNSSGLSSSSLSSSGLSSSPGQRLSDSENAQPSNTNKFMNQIKSNLQVQKHQKRINRELHIKRVQSLRKELEYLKATEWKYQPIDRALDQAHKN